MERTKRKSSVYNDCVPYGGRVPNFKEKEGMKLKKEQFDVTGMTCSACSARIEKSVSKLPGIKEVSVNLSGIASPAIFRCLWCLPCIGRSVR